MKIRILVAFVALWAGVARAQLDQILAPVPAGLAGANVAQASGVPETAAPAAGAAAARTPRAFTSDDLVNELQKQLASYFGLKGDLKLSLTRDWRSVQLPGKDFDLTLTDYPPEGITSSFGLKFKIASGGVQVGEWQVQIRAQLWQSVWVSQGRMERGQALDKSMLNAEKIDVLREKQTLLSDDTDPDGYDVAQGIGPGMPIAKQDVIERPVIHRGDLVEVIATQGMLDIHMKALALEDGGLNSLIKMRNLDSSKQFSAQILNENEVKVHF